MKCLQYQHFKSFTLLSSVLFLCLTIASCLNKKGAIEEDVPDLVEKQECPIICDLTIDSEFDMHLITWNINNFPKRGLETTNRFNEIINETNWDLLALQEVADTIAFKNLMAKAPKIGFLNFTKSPLAQTILYKKNKWEFLEQEILFVNQKSPFPRTPLLGKFKSKTEKEIVTLINIHLKAFGSKTDQRRRAKAMQLLNDYVIANPDEKIIILGDFNQPYLLNSQETFVLYKSDQYLKTDLSLEENNCYSYPSKGFHLDHIILEKEIQFKQIKASILTLDKCTEEYSEIMSDHRPLKLVMKF